MFKNIFTRPFRFLLIMMVNAAAVLLIGKGSVLAQTPPDLTTGNNPAVLAQLEPAGISFQEVASGLTSPVFIANAGDGSGRIFVVEQTGTIRILKNGSLLATPFLDIHTSIKSGGEQGLLAMAFHPLYASNGIFFVAYTAPRVGDSTGSDLVLERFSVSAGNPDLANPGSGVILLTISHPVNSNHNGGTLAFGGDGYLYWSTGDGGSGGDPANNAQQLNNLLGKILRIDVNSGAPYGIPIDNPFYSSADPNVKKEIWAYGLRNPWRLSFDKLTHDLYIGDVGQSVREEVDFQAAGSAGGQNYGWRVMEGSNCYNPSSACDQSGKVLPVAEYTHALGCSITGGYVYRGSNFPALAGYYLYGDYCSGRIFSLYKDPILGWNSNQLADTAYLISTFGEDEQGELYLADMGTGKIYNIRYQPPSRVISGNAGLTGAVITYTGGSVIADGSGNYSITVPAGWTGTVTPSSPCYTYTPQSRSYMNVSINMSAQNYTPAVTDPACAAGDINLRDSGDYNGDGKTDLAVFRPSTGMWIVKDWTTNTEMFRMAWGGGADKPVPGDYNGDGKTDLAVFRVSSLQWIVKDWTTNTEILRMSWGGLTDKLVPGDYNGDGKTDLAVYRPSTGMWIVKDWATNTEMFRMAWGGGADKPVPADYNGDGRTDIAVFRASSLQWIVKDWATNTEILRMSWGGMTDIPVPGDYNGDGKADLAVYRPSTGMWIVKDWTTNTEIFRMAWGGGADKLVPGDYNGDLKTDIGVFRAGSGQWIVKDWATTTEILRMPWGGMTDIPLSR